MFRTRTDLEGLSGGFDDELVETELGTVERLYKPSGGERWH